MVYQVNSFELDVLWMDLDINCVMIFSFILIDFVAIGVKIIGY
jgi:hypothetical protein